MEYDFGFNVEHESYSWYYDTINCLGDCSATLSIYGYSYQHCKTVRSLQGGNKHLTSLDDLPGVMGNH
jgi:hypothetical protein